MTNSLIVFNYLDYKDFLTDFVAASPKGSMTRLAIAAGCQRSYFSDVLRKNTHLTPDHAYGLAKYLKMTNKEMTYFLNLVHLARASSKHYKQDLYQQLERDRNDFQRLTSRVNQRGKNIDAEISRYYSSWHYAAIHVVTSIQEYQTIEAIAHRLNLKEEHVREILEHLVSDGFVFREQNFYKYNYSKGNIHLPDDSVHSRLNHANWRALTMSRPMNFFNEVHYTSVFAVAKNDQKQLREDLLKFLQIQREAIANSASEDLVFFSCDFMSI